MTQPKTEDRTARQRRYLALFEAGQTPNAIALELQVSLEAVYQMRRKLRPDLCPRSKRPGVVA